MMDEKYIYSKNKFLQSENDILVRQLHVAIDTLRYLYYIDDSAEYALKEIEKIENKE